MNSRRFFLQGLSCVGLACAARTVFAFGDEGVFEPKVLLAGGLTEAARISAPGRWSFEVERRTSAPARKIPRVVPAHDPILLDGPFAYWSGKSSLKPLTIDELRGLRSFLNLGGLLVVDDAEPEVGAFGRDARREIARILPDAALISVPVDHVLYRSFYVLKPAKPYGRYEGPMHAEAIIRAGQIRVLFLSHDLGGALARSTLGTWEMNVQPGGDTQREYAIRFAVNIALYALTTNYKDDTLHVKRLLEKRTGTR